MQIGDRPVVAWLLCPATLSRGCNNKNAERLGRNNTYRLRFVSRPSFALLFSDLFPSPSRPLIVPPRFAFRSNAVLSSMWINTHFYDDIKYDYAAFSRCPRAAEYLAVAPSRSTSTVTITSAFMDSRKDLRWIQMVHFWMSIPEEPFTAKSDSKQCNLIQIIII